MKGSILKQVLTDSPFVCYFEFGNGDCWKYDLLMVLQLEDCINCSKVLFSNYSRRQFLPDHSSVHANKQLGGLDEMAMNVDYGGCQPKMYATLIKDLGGYHCPFCYERIYDNVKKGKEQVLNFASDDDVTTKDGPFWMNKDEKMKT